MKNEMAHVEVYTPYQLAKKLFPHRKILHAFYQSRNTDDGLLIVCPNKQGEDKPEFYTNCHLQSLMEKFGVFKLAPSQFIIEDENGHKTSEFGWAFFFAKGKELI